jgi:hypothetical protein
MKSRATDTWEARCKMLTGSCVTVWPRQAEIAHLSLLALPRGERLEATYNLSIRPKLSIEPTLVSTATHARGKSQMAWSQATLVRLSHHARIIMRCVSNEREKAQQHARIDPPKNTRA